MAVYHGAVGHFQNGPEQEVPGLVHNWPAAVCHVGIAVQVAVVVADVDEVVNVAYRQTGAEKVPGCHFF